MSRVPCFCGHYRISAENADYVKDGRPLCHSVTCERAALRSKHPELHQETVDIRAARDVPAGTSWAFTEHRTMAEVIRAGDFDAAA